MRFNLTILLFALIISSPVYAIEDRIIARINSDIITLSELEERLQPVIAKYESTYTGQELLNQLAKAEEYWLNQLIENKLILQEAASKELSATQEEIGERYDTIKADFDSDLQFNLFLQSQGMTIDQLKNNIKENILISKATSHIREKARSRFSPTDVTEYYEAHKDEYLEEPMVNVLHILIRPDENEEEAQKKAEEIRTRIINGEDFNELARKFSDGPYAEKGGDMGFCARGQHIPEIDDYAFKLPVGEISEVFKTDLGYHIIMVKQRKKERVKPFSEVQDEIENRILREKAEDIWNEWIATLKKKSFIEIYDKP